MEEWLTCNQVGKGSSNGSLDYLMDMKVIRRKECKDMRMMAGRRAWVCLDRECKVFLQGKDSGCLGTLQDKAGKDSECLGTLQDKAGKGSECLGTLQDKAGKGSECLISHLGKAGKDSGCLGTLQDKAGNDSGCLIHRGKVGKGSGCLGSHRGKAGKDSGDQVSHQGKAVQGNSKDLGLLPQHLQTGYQNILVLHCTQ